MSNRRLQGGEPAQADERSPLLPRPDGEGQGQNGAAPNLTSFPDQQEHALEQQQILPYKKLLIVFPALALVQFTSFLDQTAISTAIPAIAKGVGAGSSISWVGASFLTANTAVQLINGRVSDIFGRKTMLITSLFIMGLGNLLSGFSQTPPQLYATRALSGLGAGGINGLVQVTISDITTLEQRGNWFGIIGIFVALGNGLGPVIGGYLTKAASWRWALWFITPMSALAALILLLVLPPPSVSGSMRSKLGRVDWLGTLTSMIAVILLLIPISQGGSALPWDSPIVITMLVLGAVFLVVFVLLEWRFVSLPIVPMRLFTNGYSANLLLAQNLAIGWVFWGNLFYLPLYFQNVRGFDPAAAGTLILPMVIAHGIFSGISGFLVSKTGGYYWIIITGATIWTVATSLKIAYDQTTPMWAFVVVGILEGLGVGFCFQPVLVALMANSGTADRAVITGLRNFLRAMGGAVGITVSGAVLGNVLTSGLKDRFPPEVVSQLASSVLSLPDLDLTQEDRDLILRTYMKGIHIVFITFAPLIGLVLVSSIMIKNKPLSSK
ncbi:putative efflux pump antibiotic resistance protein [Xylariaceae sp. FL0016]|nr:putative efflux pump antibiotic resistance protein [Xylariaceae sp. FL0016]